LSIDDLSCIFSIILRVTAAQQAFSGRDDDEARESQLIGPLRRRIAITDEFHGLTMRVVVDRKELWTPLLIVFTANVLARTGLRQLFFLLGHPVGTLVHLTDGIAFILAFFSVKLTLHARHENEVPFISGSNPVPVPEIDTITSRVVILLAMGVAIVASLVTMRPHGISFSEAGFSSNEDDPAVVEATAQDEKPDVARGNAANGSGAHVGTPAQGHRGCPDCARRLVSPVVALRDAARPSSSPPSSPRRLLIFQADLVAEFAIGLIPRIEEGRDTR